MIIKSINTFSFIILESNVIISIFNPFVIDFSNEILCLLLGRLVSAIAIVIGPFVGGDTFTQENCS